MVRTCRRGGGGGKATPPSWACTASSPGFPWGSSPLGLRSLAGPRGSHPRRVEQEEVLLLPGVCVSALPQRHGNGTARGAAQRLLQTGSPAQGDTEDKGGSEWCRDGLDQGPTARRWQSQDGDPDCPEAEARTAGQGCAASAHLLRGLRFLTRPGGMRGTTHVQ